MQKDYLFQVRTIEDIDDLPSGSSIYVKQELEKEYEGEWGFRGATCTVSVPKDKCTKLEEKI